MTIAYFILLVIVGYVLVRWMSFSYYRKKKLSLSELDERFVELLNGGERK